MIEVEREFPGRVAVYSYMPRRKLYTLPSRVHVLLFPNRWEVFGRIALEALGLGTPVVCFDIPGVPHDIVRRKRVGYVAKPFYLHDFVLGVWRIYELWRKNSDQYFELSTYAMNEAKKYSCKRIARLFKNNAPGNYRPPEQGGSIWRYDPATDTVSRVRASKVFCISPRAGGALIIEEDIIETKLS